MSDAPERIYLAQPAEATEFGRKISDPEIKSDENWPLTEYIRADLVSETALTHLAQTGQLMDRIAALEAQLAEAKEVLGKLRTTAVVLQQNVLGCAANHYGEDFTIHGTPGWLLDTQVDIDRARATLAKLEKPSPAP